MDSHGPISAAVIFAFAWAGLAVVNNISLKRRPGWDYAELTTFCWIRVAAFACEAAAAHHPDRLRNALFEGLYDGGFFLILVVLYGVFKKWLEEAHNHTYLPFTELSDTAKGRIQLGYTILCWLMPVFSALGIGAAAASLTGHSNDNDCGASDALHATSGAGFLGVLTIYIGAIAVVIANVGRSKMADTSYCIQELTPLALVALLLLLKVCFQLACQTYTAAWVNPALFYPLSALPEILAVVVLTWPGFLMLIKHSRLNFGGSATVGPITTSSVAQQQSIGYQNGNFGNHSTGQGRPQWPSSHAEGYGHQPIMYEASTEGYPQRPYHEHIQAPGYSSGTLPQQADYPQHQHEQHEQHSSRVPFQAQQGYPPPQAAFQQPSLPFQQARLPYQQVHLPVEPAPVDFQQSALYPPYYPHHGHAAPSFFLPQQPQS